MRNKDYHLYPKGQGGFSDIPVAGIVSGLTVALGGAGGSGVVAAVGQVPAKAQVTISAGVARFGGIASKLASSATFTVVVPTAVDLAADNYNLQVWLKPTYKVPASVTAPANPTDGAQYLQLVDTEYRAPNGTVYYKVNSIQIYKNSSWRAIDPLKEIPQPLLSQGNQPFNEVVGVLTVDNFSTKPDGAVVLDSPLAPYLSNVGANRLRQSNSILLAEVNYVGGVGTIVSTVDEEYTLPL